jgi:hypothetical protein
MRSTKKLLEKRREVKEYINANLHNTPMALLLRFPSLLIRRFFGCSSYLSTASNAILMGILIVLPTLVTVLGFNEFDILKPLEWLGVFVVLEGFCVSVFMAHFNVNRLLMGIRNSIVDSMVSISDLCDLQQWLSLGWTPKILKIYLLCWVTFLIPIAIFNMYIVFGKFQHVSLYVWVITFLVLSGFSWSYAPLNMILPVRLSRYQYSLHEIDPARSEIISRISSNLNYYSYGYALNAAVVQLIFAAVGRFYLFGISAAFIAWIPITIQFALSQLSLRRIIVNAKWRTLHGIQVQLRELHGTRGKSKNNLDVIWRLMDYHDRIRETPNSTLDLRSLINLSNQLAIPSLGLIVANIEKIIGFFR